MAAVNPRERRYRTADIRPATYAGFFLFGADLIWAGVTGQAFWVGMGVTSLACCVIAGGHSARWERRRALGHAALELDRQAAAHGEAIRDYTDLLRVWADDESRWKAGS